MESEVPGDTDRDSGPNGISMSNIMQGVNEVVNTRYGPVTVTILGDRSKSPCLAYHEAGINHRTCFRSLLVASGPQSLLLKNYYILFINAPGHEAPDAEIPPQILPITLEKLAEQIEDVVKHYKMREIVCLGVGNGANILVQFAAANPKAVVGMILISPTCRKCGWIEWGRGSLASRQLKLFGWTAGAKEHVAQRLLGSTTLQIYGGDSDLVQSLKRDFEEVSPSAAAHYIDAALTRQDITALVKKVDARVLLLYGSEGLYAQESLDYGTAANKAKFAILEVMDTGVLVCEERPGELFSPLQLFLTSLQLEGYGLGDSLMVGE